MRTLKETTKKDYSERMLKVLQFIQQHLDDQISLEKLAQVACFSPYHFHRIFSGMIGESVKGHIRRLRLERAASRLKFGKRPVTQLAFEAGYEAHEAFTRAFSEMFNTSPLEYRRSYQKFSGINNGSHNYTDDNLQQFNQFHLENNIMKVEITEMETMMVAYTKHVGPYNECGKAWEKLCTWAGPRGLLRPNSKFIGLCYDDPEITSSEKIRYDACISIDEKIEVEGEIGLQTIDSGSYAMTTHLGPYEELSKTYAQLCGQWVPQNGYEIASKPSIEIYLNSPEDTEPEDLITDIHVPLEAE